MAGAVTSAMVVVMTMVMIVIVAVAVVVRVGMGVKLRVEMLVVVIVTFVVVVVAMVMAMGGIVVMIVCRFVDAFWRVAASPPQRLLLQHRRACVGDLRATAAMTWQAVRMRMQE